MIVIEDGSGVVDANSYVTVAEYRGYATPRGVTLPVSDTDCETQIILAMDYLEIQPWAGYPTYPDQALAWPRSGVYISGSEIADDAIPGKIKFAQMQLSIQVNAGVELMPTIGAEVAVKREKVGPLETEYDTSNVGMMPYFRSVSALLAPYLSGMGFGQFRATRG